MHISIVGNARWQYNAEHDWRTGFEALGHTCKIVSEVGTGPDDLVKEAARSDFLMWVSANRTHSKETFDKCKATTLVIGWHPDLFWGLSRRRWTEAPVWDAEVVFTADGGHDALWEKMGVNHRWLLPGVRSMWVNRGATERDGYLCDVAFVGNNGSSYHPEWPYRKQLVENLQKMCAKNGWTFKNPGGASRKIERDRRMNDFYRSAKVTVGDSLCLDQNLSKYWSDRVYEATGRGGVLIMPQIDALSAQTGSWLPTYPWGDWNALEATVGGLLASETRRDELRAQGRAWAAENHTYEVRAAQLLNELGF
jgi:hypothetical protein